mgnify:CR=1 FL=1
MADDTLIYNPEWIGGDWDADTSVLDVLDTLGSNNPAAVAALDEAFTAEDTVGTDSAGNPIVEGITALSEYEPSQTTMDKIAPAIAIGGYETVKGIAKGLHLPEGIAAKTRIGGTKAVSYDLAIRAGSLGADIAQDIVGTIAPGKQLSPGAETVVGLGAGVAAYKAVPKIAKHIVSGVKTGMAAQVVPALATEAAEVGVKEIIKQGGEEVIEKFGRTLEEFAPYPKKGPLQTPTGRLPTHLPKHQSVKTATQLAKNQISKQVSDELAVEVKKRIGKEAAKGWDDVLVRLTNPNIRNRVGMYLAKHAPKTAATLAGSASAFAFPEWVSTGLGALGFGWAAWDIFNLANQMPELKSLLFEDAPTEVVEDTIMDQMSAEETIFPPDEQRTP